MWFCLMLEIFFVLGAKSVLLYSCSDQMGLDNDALWTHDQLMIS